MLGKINLLRRCVVLCCIVSVMVMSSYLIFKRYIVKQKPVVPSFLSCVLKIEYIALPEQQELKGNMFIKLNDKKEGKMIFKGKLHVGGQWYPVLEVVTYRYRIIKELIMTYHPRAVVRDLHLSEDMRMYLWPDRKFEYRENGSYRLLGRVSDDQVLNCGKL